MKRHGRRLTHKISIEEKSQARDSIGGDAPVTWTEFAPAWAEVKPITGREFLSAQAHQNSVTHRVELRYIDGIKPDMRISHKDRYFNILSVRDYFERERWLELMCEEII